MSEAEEKERLDGILRDVDMVIYNTQRLSEIVDWCVLAMIKRAARGEVMRLEHLAETSTVASLLTAAKKELASLGCPVSLRRADYAVVRESIADTIWTRFKEEAEVGDSMIAWRACETMGWNRQC